MIRATTVFTLGLLLNGCLVTVESDSDSVQQVWSDSDVSRLKLGLSDGDWVRSSFGDPVTKLNYADGTEIWKYRNISEEDTEVGVFLLFSIDVEQERVETLSIEFTNGVVTNYWIEEERF
ncbi:MAG: hypothetical protein O3B02_11190 [Proteobacteria bacterium]|nr:hypothetical protein [Pseudomonadota bacterium]